MPYSSNYINIHTHESVQEIAETAIVNIDICEQQQLSPQRLYSVGLHPWSVQPGSVHYLDQIAAYASQENVKAIGETGIDRNIKTPLSLQKELFKAQIRIATNVGKPVIIHCVRAFPEIIAIYKEMQPGIPFVFHGYNNNLQIARHLLSIEGFYLSFGNALERVTSNAARVLKETPAGKFFLETDNGITTISGIFARAAEIKQCTVAAIKQQVALNFKRVFSNE